MTYPNRDKKNIQAQAWQWRVLAKLVFGGRFAKLQPLLRAVEYGAGRTFAKEDMDRAIDIVVQEYAASRERYLAERDN